MPAAPGRTLAILLALVGLGVFFSEPARAESPRIESVFLIPDSARPADEARGQVLLSGPAPEGGVHVHLSTGPAAWIPGTVVVPAGQTTAGFVVFFQRGGQDQELEVKASLGGQLATSNRLQAPADPRKVAPADARGPVHASGMGEPHPDSGSLHGSRSPRPAPTYGPQVPGIPAVRMPSMWDWRPAGTRR